ncbi:glutamine synthetase family protein [Haloarcula amylovorans]|uniref:glutamine synthetase family protein n=1 Tax=Haloarcula amylovorans TaxID=2562280 RepID=UPI001ADD82EC|nr:glutamine synthetase family protein [Halomicroarcula amylolytica]
MERRIEEAGVEHVVVEFADINGISRSKTVSAGYFADSWRDGFPINLLLLVQTPRSEIPTGSGYGEEIDYGDGVLRPDPATFRVLPWTEDTGRVICDVEYDGEPVSAAPRNALKRVLDDCDFEFDFYIGSELEFYLLEESEDSYEPATDHKHECVSWATEEISPFYDTLSDWAGDYGVDLTSLQHEHGAGQLEILFDYGKPLAQADTTFDFKRLVKRTARLAEQWATFMAKPFGDRAGSGYHLHVSAFDGDENAFTAANGDLSNTARHFVGGLLEHAPALAAFQTPTLNAFKRFSPEGFAPYTASWGYDNRMVALRIPQGTTRIENRIGSADANPYLVIASTLAAGIDGIRRQLEPTDPVEGDPTGRRPRLPQTPESALQALEADDVFRETFGERLIQAYVASKRRELQDFHDTVTEWEREQYVETL